MSLPGICGLIAMAHVADLKRSVDFYRLLGMEIRGSERNPAGELQWVDLVCGQAQLMLTRASEAMDGRQQGVVFYLYSADLIHLREHLLAHGIEVSAITYPSFMTKGEMQFEDPDGYRLFIGQAG